MKKIRQKPSTAVLRILTEVTGHLYDRAQLAKLMLCLQVAFSSFFGFVYASQASFLQAIGLAFAVFLLASGAASLNSYQERYQDALMQRTRNRPLVCKKITEQHALLQSVFLIFFGLVLIFQIGNSKALLAGIVAVLLYNVVYTRLKERTLYALLPGALCGAMPPYIGYLAAESGGSVFHAALPVLLLFFWQVPHFFLILMNHKQDYLSGPVPNLLQRLGEPVLQRILLPWIAALAMIMLAFTVMPSSLGDIASSLIVMNALSLIGVFAFQLLYRKEPSYGFLFRYLNISLLFMMIVVCSAIV